MRNLIEFANQMGCKISYEYNGTATSTPEAGKITLQPGNPEIIDMIDLAHELGHIITYIKGDSEQRFPHLRLFRKNRRYYLKSKSFMKSVYKEEEEAWNVAEQLLKDFEYLPEIFYKYKEKNLKTYAKQIKSSCSV